MIQSAKLRLHVRVNGHRHSAQDAEPNPSKSDRKMPLVFNSATPLDWSQYKREVEAHGMRILWPCLHVSRD
jgi:hypothetical protein